LVLAIIMITFVKNKIIHNQELIAQELKQARIRQNISFKKASEKTGISQKYLEAMEAGEFSKLPPGIYSKNFLKEYAIFLGIDVDAILELYIEEAGEKYINKKQKFFSARIPSRINIINLPKIVKIISVFIVTIVCLFYLGIYIKKIIAPPYLSLTEPSADLVVHNNLIKFFGHSDTEAQIKINDELILMNAEGSFSKEINLKDGLNTIVVVAQKKYSQKNEIIRKIYVESEQKP